MHYESIDYQKGSRELRGFESVDIVKSRYKAKHGGVLNTTNATSIAMSVRQGRNMLDSAVQSDYVDKPVRLYYAAAAFMRAELMFSCCKSESALVNKHGLEVLGFPVKCNTIDDLLNVQLSYTDGTFKEWFTDTQGSMQVRQGSSAPTTTIPIDTSIGTKRISLGSLLRLVPDVWKEYEDTSGVHLAKLKNFSYDPDGISAFEGNGDMTKEQIASWFPGDLAKKLNEVSSQKWEINTGKTGFEPQFIQSNRGPFGLGDIFIGEHNDGLRLTTLGIYVSIAYLLSMIARYRPSIWGSVWNLGDLDSAQPLLSQVMIEIQDRLAMDFVYSINK